MSRFHHARQRSFIVLAFVVLAGCRDESPLGSPSADPQPALALAEKGALRDDGIDTRDTYFAFNITTTRTTEGAGEPDGIVAAAMIGEYATDESAYLEAGFGADGVLRFNVYSDGSADPRLPMPPPVVRSVGNDISIYDEWGTVVESYDFDTFLEGTGLPGGNLAIGSPYGTLYNPLGRRPGGGAAAGQPVEIMGVDPERTKVRHVRDDVLQVTTTSGGWVGVQAAGGTGAEIRTTRTYRRRGVPTSGGAGEPNAASSRGAMAHWVLESVDQAASVPGARGASTVRTHTTYQYVAAHINRSQDESREGALRASIPASAMRSITAGARGGGRGANLQDGGRVAASTDAINLCEKGPLNSTRTVSAGGSGVVYQHGFCANGTTWSAMRERVPETHRVGVEQIYSLNSDAPIESQVDDLAARLAAAGVTGNVVVAHSQGGLVARRLGQRRPDLVSGVVTIGTPHEGALIASRPASLLASALNDAIGRPCFGNLCTLSSEVGEAVAAGLLTRGVGALIPAAGDDQPGSALIQRLNGHSEPQYETFRRASIAMNVQPRWAVFRLIGDLKTDRNRLLTGEPLKGRGYVRDAQRLYDAARVLRYMAMALRWRATDYGYGWGCQQSGYASYWEPCYNSSGYASHWWQTSYWYFIADALDFIAGVVIGTLNTFDRVWDDATTGRVGGTDGFVQLASQHYPAYVPGAWPIKRYQINGLEAHTGETASLAVLGQLRLALDYAALPRQ
ncbi:MAG TPA: alpha/beta hydrolase [Longimicrobium sp.]|nr:alpha/beta hydrolase [Longimicrobium sp.]